MSDTLQKEELSEIETKTLEIANQTVSAILSKIYSPNFINLFNMGLCKHLLDIIGSAHSTAN